MCVCVCVCVCARACVHVWEVKTLGCQLNEQPGSIPTADFVEGEDEGWWKQTGGCQLEK